MPKPPAAAPAVAPHLERGRAAEHIAARYLQSKGLTVLARNFRCRSGELDLVCLDAGVLAVIEVRQRTGSGFGGPLASVSQPKQRRLIRAAGCFLRHSPGWRSVLMRFDVVAVSGPPEALHDIVWIKDAFRGV
jgi:putative endonuclease